MLDKGITVIKLGHEHTDYKPACIFKYQVYHVGTNCIEICP